MKARYMNSAVLLLVVSSLLLSGCVIECEKQECHGLEVTCGKNAPDTCTMNYQIGDFCRKFVTCEVHSGKCMEIEDPNYEVCTKCVTDCLRNYRDEAFDCEAKCRELVG